VYERCPIRGKYLLVFPKRFVSDPGLIKAISKPDSMIIDPGKYDLFCLKLFKFEELSIINLNN
jgi:hypothetical protein